MRLCLIANPVSGGDAGSRIAHAKEWFETRGHSVELLLTEHSGDAETFAAQVKEQGFDRIVAAGGDGTLNEVINGLVPSPIPLAFLPLGTTNVFALEAGIPFQLEQACQTALEGTPRQVTLGVANNKYFLLMISAGFDAIAVHRVNLGLKRRIGKSAYVFSALASLFNTPLPAFEVINDDGQSRPACQILVGNGRLYGGRFSITPRASLFASELEVCQVSPMSRLRFIVTLVALLGGLTPPGVVRFSTTQMQLNGQGVPLQLDGDSSGFLPCTVTVKPGDIQLVFPK